jgi:hypothetical protein
MDIGGDGHTVRRIQDAAGHRRSYGSSLFVGAALPAPVLGWAALPVLAPGDGALREVVLVPAGGAEPPVRSESRFPAGRAGRDAELEGFPALLFGRWLDFAAGPVVPVESMGVAAPPT